MSPRRDLGTLTPPLSAQVLTLVGDAFPRRVGLSLLAQIEFTAGTAQDGGSLDARIAAREARAKEAP